MDSPSARTNRGTTSQLVVEMVQAALREVDVLPEQASALKTAKPSAPEPCRASYPNPTMSSSSGWLNLLGQLMPWVGGNGERS